MLSRRPLSRAAVLLLALASVLVLLCVEAAWAKDEDLDAETVSLDDLVEEEMAAQDAAAADAATSAAELEDVTDFDIVEVLGADLACSACELTMDTLVRNYASASSVIRRQLEDEAAAKLKAEEEANAAAEAAKEEGDEETIELGTKDGDEEEEEKEEESGDDSEDGETDKKKEKKGKDKKKKKGKNKNKKTKNKKKTPEVKVDPKKVAAVVMAAPCNASDFVGVKTIGTYPGRRYDSYGAGLGSYDTYGSGKKSKKKQAKEIEKVSDLVKTCRKLTEKEGEGKWLKQKLASPSSRSSKSLKKIKSDFCVKRHKMCKSAALGFEAESACLAKMLRHMAAGEFDKATKLSKKCPKESVVKSA